MQIEITIPDARRGDWSVESFTVDPNDFSQQLAQLKYGRAVPGGTYKRLLRRGAVIMSNTPDEIRDFSYFVHSATGSVLVNGLGLGVVLTALLAKPGITDITVIEQSQDVIDLIAPHFNDERLTIHCADAFTWQPPKGKHYNYVWHDIWDNICSDNLPEMTKLHRKYGQRSDNQESWCRAECRRMSR